MTRAWMFDPRVRTTMYVIFTLALLVLAACGKTGTYQGGGDSEPYYR